jgi:hypothetical protein
MKKLLLVFALLLLPQTICLADEMAVSAAPLDNPSGSRCKVILSDYRSGSAAQYVGNCGWTGLNGTGAYVQGWNHSNHIKVVRGQFVSGRVESFAKVTYINKVKNIVQTYEENSYMSRNFTTYQLGDILADAHQSGLNFDNTVSAYIKLANYIDIRE